MMSDVILSFSRKPLSKTLTPKNTRDQDSQADEDGPHGVEEDGLFAEVVHVKLSKFRDDFLANVIKSGFTEN